MLFYIDILNLIDKLSLISEKIDESWAHIVLEGNYHTECCDILQTFQENFDKVSISSACTIRLDNSIVSGEELIEYKSASNSYSTWKLNLNKQALISRKFNSDFNINFFFKADNCERWLNEINPIAGSSPLNILSPLKIIIKDLQISFGGEYLYFLPAEQKYFSHVHKNPIVLPGQDQIISSVHFIPDFKVSFNPNTYIITEGDYSSSLSKCLLKKSSIVLACCIVNEFYSFNQVILDGLKHITLSLVDDSINYTYGFNQELVSLVSWLYEDRVSTRKKLFNERLTLELSEADSLLISLQKHLKSSFQQAKERFNFVILDRKDAYIKELKDLLKDLRSQSDLYSLKIRTLLTNFLRDILAAIVLIGFTIFTKFTDNVGLEKHKLLEYVFYGLAIYYLISIVFQAVVDWSDIIITNRELKYWKNASKELIPESEFDRHLRDSLQDRRISLWILYPIIGTLYLLIAYACFKYPAFFKSLITQ